MSPLDLSLRPLRVAPLSEPFLRGKIRELDRITAHLTETGSLDTPDQIADLRDKLREGFRNGERFAKCTAVPRRRSRLLTLYLMDLSSDEDRGLLPPFDKQILNSVLGGLEESLKKDPRRQATLLYFTHYGEKRIPSLNFMARRLRASWQGEGKDRFGDGTSEIFRDHAAILFAKEAPSKVAAEWQPGESVDQLADRFGIPPGGEFRERLLEELVLTRLRMVSDEEIGEELDDLVISAKNRLLTSGYPLGAEAVRTLIDRSITEFQGKVPGGWCEQIVTYSCDPRIPNAGEQTKWWGWASSKKKTWRSGRSAN